MSVVTPPDLAGYAYESAVRAKAANLRRELIRQTIDDIESWTQAVDVQWRYEHPGMPMPIRTTDDEIQRYYETVRTDFYEWVEPAFERYLRPDPDALNPMIDALRGIESTFGGGQDDAVGFFPVSPALSRINDIRADMGEWQGDLQENFIDGFLTPLQSTSLNQASVAKVIREQLECGKVVYIRCRRGIIELLDTALAAVEALNNDCDPKTLLWGTLVLTAVGTGFALAPELAVAGAVLSIAGTMAQGLIPDPQKTNKLSAATAQEVAINLAHALSAMEGDLLDEERKMENALRRIYDTMSRSRADSVSRNISGPLAVAVPALATAQPADFAYGSLRPAHRVAGR